MVVMELDFCLLARGTRGDPIGAAAQQVTGQQALASGFEDFTAGRSGFGKNERRTAVADAKVEIEFVEARFELDAAARRAQHLEQLHGAERGAIDDVAASRPMSALLGE